MIAIVAALPEEARALRRRLRERCPLPGGHGTIGLLGRQQIALAVTGDGAERARGGLERLLAAAPLQGVIGVGFCGALSEGVEFGSLIVARGIAGKAGPLPPPHSAWISRAQATSGATAVTIVAASTLLLTSAQKAEARRRAPTSLAVADLESAAWAAAASRAGLPYLILRVVSDTVREELPPILARSLRRDGSVDRFRLLRGALKRPGSLPALLRLAGRARRGARVLADGLEALVTHAPSLEEST